MSFKNKLIELRDRLLSLFESGSRNYEFNGVFENHPIGDQDVYRLYYVNYNTFTPSIQPIYVDFFFIFIS